ncbi:MAG TPA: GxxExxY protein [Gemmatimonadales bacterium]|nr:GxxExxY protein [Gemmatimonadales bacterium]
MTRPPEQDPKELSGLVIGAAIEVHRALGPGLLESAYQACLATEFRANGLEFAREVAVPLVYRGIPLDCAYRADFLVAGSLLVEAKCVESLHPIHTAQLLTYLRLTERHLGLLINFNVPRLLLGVRRVVNHLPEPSASPAPLR